jgi:hypothetical protein
MARENSESEINRLKKELAKEKEQNVILKEELEKYNYATERLVRKIELDNKMKLNWDFNYFNSSLKSKLGATWTLLNDGFRIFFSRKFRRNRNEAD